MPSGGCYCGEVRYEISADPVMSAQCHCRPCQYISGGGPNYYMLVKPDSFTYTQGEAKPFKRSDIEHAVTREFCPNCGTHVMTRRPGIDFLIVKAGTLDDPADYGKPKMAIFCAEMAPYHVIPEGMPAFDGLPERR